MSDNGDNDADMQEFSQDDDQISGQSNNSQENSDDKMSDEENDGQNNKSDDDDSDEDNDEDNDNDSSYEILMEMQDIVEEKNNENEAIEEEDKTVKQKITPTFLTKYEKAKVIGMRAQQISKNSPIYVTLDDNEFDPITIAEKEFQAKKIPFIIRRYLPDKKTFEDWKLEDLTYLI